MEYKEQNMEYRMRNMEYCIQFLRNSKFCSRYLTFSVLGSFCIRLFTFDFRLSTRRRGVATLPTVMLLGVMSLVVAVSITTLSFTELFISQGSAQSSRAHFYAEAGARDALIKVARNKTYLCASTDCYSVNFTTNGCTLSKDCAKVQVTGNDTAKTITSKGIMNANTRTLQVALTLDTDGLITGAVWSEVTN